jgi:hypothetical protein
VRTAIYIYSKQKPFPEIFPLFPVDKAKLSSKKKTPKKEKSPNK